MKALLERLLTLSDIVSCTVCGEPSGLTKLQVIKFMREVPGKDIAILCPRHPYPKKGLFLMGEGKAVGIG